MTKTTKTAENTKTTTPAAAAPVIAQTPADDAKVASASTAPTTTAETATDATTQTTATQTDASTPADPPTPADLDQIAKDTAAKALIDAIGVKKSPFHRLASLSAKYGGSTQLDDKKALAACQTLGKKRVNKKFAEACADALVELDNATENFLSEEVDLAGLGLDLGFLSFMKDDADAQRDRAAAHQAKLDAAAAAPAE